MAGRCYSFRRVSGIVGRSALSLTFNIYYYAAFTCAKRCYNDDRLSKMGLRSV